MDTRAVANEIGRHVSPPWPYRHLDELHAQVAGLTQAVDDLEILGALERIRLANQQLMLIAQTVLEIAAKETTITQKRLAAALDVPPSTLRGLRT